MYTCKGIEMIHLRMLCIALQAGLLLFEAGKRLHRETADMYTKVPFGC